MNEDVLGLPVLDQLSEHVSVRRIGELPLIVVDHPRVRAAVAPQGAHLVAWQPEGEAPVIWLSDATAFEQGVAIRGGVPICWPWFGPAGKPSHGFARTSTFQLDAHSEDELGAELAFRLRGDEHTKALWPHEFELFVHFKLGQACEISLQAHGDYQSTGALHSYFSVGDIDGVAVSGLGVPYLDKVAETEGRQDGALTFPGRIDRVYTAPDGVSRIEDPALNRRVEIRHHHNSDVVAWNPGPELSASMADLTDDGYRQFACVETARVSTPMTSTPDNPATLSATITLTH
ncbi:D-hexose-6-phosphate mutarotase [Actinospica sp.]|jgi:glucose-6-phosphate 1-epimerase|uniref:D-hexose-6-phosphate mutarotase n=1 Tax=Actinospica sp. TaxID=1872142 RepID=UPI002C102F61|nr:D-hexose-6-phosphate mutarotase [Actinospica sp.]HWG28513.1 D-hexose-6-phosphate mutarotase [Actinospica sp.]